MFKDLSHERVKELLDYNPETGVFIWKKYRNQYARVGDIAGFSRADGYTEIRIGKHLYKSHRLAWFYTYGVAPIDMVDHINGVRNDNRISNLREANNSQNQMNRPKQTNNTSGYKGVHWFPKSNKWRARIRANNKQISLGLYDDIEDAAEAYKMAAMQYHQEFYNIN